MRIAKIGSATIARQRAVFNVNNTPTECHLLFSKSHFGYLSDAMTLFAAKVDDTPIGQLGTCIDGIPVALTRPALEMLP
jgi:hypothetical protein